MLGLSNWTLGVLHPRVLVIQISKDCCNLVKNIKKLHVQFQNLRSVAGLDLSHLIQYTRCHLDNYKSCLAGAINNFNWVRVIINVQFFFFKMGGSWETEHPHPLNTHTHIMRCLVVWFTEIRRASHSFSFKNVITFMWYQIIIIIILQTKWNPKNHLFENPQFIGTMH